MFVESLPKCFVAYPSAPVARAETVESVIETISRTGVVDIKGWRSISPGGRPIISRIFEEIRDCKCFIADLTGLNPNVLFELGYAVAHRKRIWLLLDVAIEKAKLEFDRFQLFTTVGYQGASNSEKIVKGFFADQPYADDTNLCDELLDRAKKPTRPTMLYLKAQTATEASNRLSRKVVTAEIASIIDDPAESANEPLAWYVNRVDSSSAVVCHLLSSAHSNWQASNAKQAFVAGMAQGLGKPLLMLAHDPYVSPLDYKDLLRVHETAAKAETLFDEWFSPLIESIRKQEKSAEAYKDQKSARSLLEQINLGESIAENESDAVTEYFIPTAVYNEALRANHSIFIGRKGTGKTATFYKLHDELSKDPRNHVCLIKPIAYELEGVVQLLNRTMGVSATGYLIESLWKFLISTELARSLYAQINSKPVYYGRTPDERDLLEFIEQNTSWIMPEFSIRLESVIDKLLLMPAAPSIESHRQSIQYSHFALNSLMAENAGQIKKIDKLLAQFSLSPEIITELDLLAYIERADVEERPSDVVDFLCELAFLGPEVENNRFEYMYDEENTEKLNAMASRSAAQNPVGLRRFRINHAYHKYLEVKPGLGRSPQQQSIVLESGT